MTKQQDPVEKGHAAVWWGIGAFFFVGWVFSFIWNSLAGSPWDYPRTGWFLLCCFLTSYCILRVVKAVRR